MRVADTAELAAIVPYLLGYQPRRDLVLVALHDGSRSGLVARAGLTLTGPEGDDEADVTDETDETVAELVLGVQRDGAPEVLLVSYEEAPDESRLLAGALREALAAVDVEVAQEIVVRDGTVRVVDGDGRLGPLHPLPDPVDVPAVADLVVSGRAVLPDRDSQFHAIRPRPDGQCGEGLLDRIEQFRTAYFAARAAGLLHLQGVDAVEVDELLTDEVLERVPVAPPPSLLRAAQVRTAFQDTCRADRDHEPWPWDTLQDRCLAAWGAVLRGEAAADEIEALLPELVAPLADHGLRDALTAWLTPGSVPLSAFDPALCDALSRLLGDELRGDGTRRGGSTKRALAGKARRNARRRARRTERVTGAATTSESAVDVTEDAVELLRVRQDRLGLVCRTVPASYAPEVLAVAASHAWWRDDWRTAALCAEEALSIDPEHRMSSLVLHAVRHGMRADGTLVWASGGRPAA